MPLWTVVSCAPSPASLWCYRRPCLCPRHQQRESSLPAPVPCSLAPPAILIATVREAASLQNICEHDTCRVRTGPDTSAGPGAGGASSPSPHILCCQGAPSLKTDPGTAWPWTAWQDSRSVWELEVSGQCSVPPAVGSVPRDDLLWAVSKSGDGAQGLPSCPPPREASSQQPRGPRGQADSPPPQVLGGRPRSPTLEPTLLRAIQDKNIVCWHHSLCCLHLSPEAVGGKGASSGVQGTRSGHAWRMQMATGEHSRRC